MPTPMLEWAIVPLMMAADRIWGSDVKHGRAWSIMIAVCALTWRGWSEVQAPFTIPAGFLFGLPHPAITAPAGAIAGFALAAAWLGTRNLRFKAFGGSATPRKDGQFLGLVIRHAFVVVPVVGLSAHFITHTDPIRPMLTYAAWALAAGVLGLMYGEANARSRDAGQPINRAWNALLEMVRGALFGIARVFA